MFLHISLTNLLGVCISPLKRKQNIRSKNVILDFSIVLFISNLFLLNEFLHAKLLFIHKLNEKSCMGDGATHVKATKKKNS